MITIIKKYLQSIFKNRKLVITILILQFNFNFSNSLYSQIKDLTKNEIIHGKIKSCSVSKCQFVFGKPENCKNEHSFVFDINGNVIEDITGDENERPNIFRNNICTKTYFKYDAKDNLIEQKDVKGRDTTLTKYEYDSKNRNIKTSIFWNGILQATSLIEYNNLGKIINEKYFESENLVSNTEVKYNTKGQEIKRIIYKNNKQTFTYENLYENNYLTLTTGYNLNNELIYLYKCKYDNLGHEIENLTFNGTDSILTTTFFDKNIKLSKKVRVNPNTKYEIITDSYFEKDTIVLERKIDEKKYLSIKRFKYDDKKRLIQRYSKDSGLIKMTSVESFIYNDKNQLVETNIKPDTNSQHIVSQTIYNYDVLGKLTSVLSSQNTEGISSKSYYYNDNMKLIKLIEYPFSNNDSVVSFYLYDTKTGKKIQEITKKKKIDYLIDYSYDVYGNLITENKYSLSNQKEKKDIENIQYEYDIEHKLINKIIEVKSKISSFSMRELKTGTKLQENTSSTDVNIKYCIAYKYDKNKNLIYEFEDKNRFNSNNGTNPIKYIYNEKNQLLEKIELKNLDTNKISIKRTYQYDSKGTLITETIIMDGISYLKKFEYDTNYNLITEIEYSSKGQDNLFKKCNYNSNGKIMEEISYKPNRSLLKYVYETNK